MQINACHNAKVRLPVKKELMWITYYGQVALSINFELSFYAFYHQDRAFGGYIAAVAAYGCGGKSKPCAVWAAGIY
jgi:hypothetical protein